MKIVLIGPSYPYRGGIAHYMTLLYRELKKSHTVNFFGFRRQYPSFMYPGMTDKDISINAIKEEGVVRLLDSLNPFTWRKTAKRIEEIAPDIVIFSWWVAFWMPCFWLLSKMIKASTKAKILFICHNVIEHESRWIKKMLTKHALSIGDYFIVHSYEDLDNLERILPKRHIKKTFHPTYDIFTKQAPRKQEAKEKLGLSGNTLLFFGFVRPYKGLEFALQALPAILKEIDVTLLVVGEFWKDKAQYEALIKNLDIEDKVVIVDHYVANEDVGLYFSACDLVLLPYTSATGSGIVQIAFAFEKPVVASRVGCLPEVISDDKTGYLIAPEDPQAIADSVIDFYRERRSDEFARHIASQKEMFSWAHLADVIESFLKEKKNGLH